MNERIKELRKCVGMTLEAFGNRLGVTKSAMSNIEKRNRSATEQLIRTICLQSWDGRYVNEDWLRWGEGEMFLYLPPEDEAAAAVSDALEDIECEDIIYTLVKEVLIKYKNSDSNSRKVLRNFVSNVLDGLKKEREEN